MVQNKGFQNSDFDTLTHELQQDSAIFGLCNIHALLRLDKSTN